ncbi:DUF7740 domain-containing protein [Pseudomonas citronellolis]|uniref:DUF7740 domain-containing protein n=1 Tax=Pseudomonas citronellolis TaxID=53408 RepID=UPI0021C0B8FD|nr:hypothetical protein [Pseudomonas citronellolis]UXJ54852.1 hypothetical protein N5P21_11835 [Pseudomonas citronellolis]
MGKAALPGVPLPRWLMNTRTMELNSLDVVLAVALVLQVHGTAEAVRQLAGRIRDKVCMEHRPKMRALARLQNDELVLQTALNIVQRATDVLGIHPGTPFPIPGARLVEPPRCHDKPMRLAGEAGARHWACSCCTNTTPLEGAG